MPQGVCPYPTFMETRGVADGTSCLGRWDCRVVFFVEVVPSPFSGVTGVGNCPLQVLCGVFVRALYLYSLLAIIHCYGTCPHERAQCTETCVASNAPPKPLGLEPCSFDRKSAFSDNQYCGQNSHRPIPAPPFLHMPSKIPLSGPVTVMGKHSLCPNS